MMGDDDIASLVGAPPRGETEPEPEVVGHDVVRSSRPIKVVTTSDRELARALRQGAGLGTSKEVTLGIGSTMGVALARATSRIPREWMLEVLADSSRTHVPASGSWGDVFVTHGNDGARRETYVGRLGSRGLRVQVVGAYVSARLALPASYVLPAGATARWGGMLCPSRPVFSPNLASGATADLATTETIVPIPDWTTLMRFARGDVSGAGVIGNVRINYYNAAGAVVATMSISTAVNLTSNDYVIPAMAVSVGVANATAAGGIQPWTLRFE